LPAAGGRGSPAATVTGRRRQEAIANWKSPDAAAAAAAEPAGRR
jgi:hypothetical protein